MGCGGLGLELHPCQARHCDLVLLRVDVSMDPKDRRKGAKTDESCLVKKD